jgi:Glycosyltransferases involved in cell wall biogenesis
LKTKIRYGIIIPCFNENNTIIRFVSEVESVLNTIDESFECIVVNDASTDDTLYMLKEYQANFHSNRNKLTVLSLNYNVGHQGAIYQGLLYASKRHFDYVIVMDGDGEDDPNVIRELIQVKGYDIVHVIRGKRSENLLFRTLYTFYKKLFKLITRKSMKIGNFGMINRKVVFNLVDSSFIHFAANLSKLKASSAHIVADRRKRLGGSSKMNVESLVYHAFKSFVVYAEDLLMLFLKLFVILAIGIFGLILYIIYQKLFTNNAILGWASTLTSSLFTTAMLSMGFFVLGVLLLNILQKNDLKQKEIYKIVDQVNEPSVIE